MTGLNDPSKEPSIAAVTELVRLLNCNLTFVLNVRKAGNSNETLNCSFKEGILGRVTLTIGA